MHLNNEISIESFLYQRNPMLMVDRVIDVSEREIIVRPITIDILNGNNQTFYPWKILESMGQAAELLWRIKGMQGKCYLIRVDDYTNFPLKLTVQDYDFYIKVEAQNSFNNMCQSSIQFFYCDNKYASVKITHYFEG